MNLPPKHLPVAMPAKYEPKVPTPQEIRDAKQTHTKILLAQATAFGLMFMDLMLPSNITAAFRKGREPQAILDELNQFFSARLRPWRSHQNRRSTRARLARARAATVKRDKEIQLG